LDEEAWQALLDGAAVACRIDNPAEQPQQADRGGSEVAQGKREDPKRSQEDRHPLVSVLMDAEDALEVRIAGRRRKGHAELATGDSNACREAKNTMRRTVA